MVALARGGSEEAQAQAARALKNLAIFNADNQATIVAAGAIEPLVALARGGSASTTREAAGVLRMLAMDAENKEAMGRLGFTP